MVLRMLKKAVFSFKTAVVTSLPFCGPPLDCGLSLLSRQAAQAANSRGRNAVPDGLGARLYCNLADAGHFLGETGMNEVVMMDGSQTEQILQNAIDHKVAAIMSYLSKGKWHVAKVVITAFDADTLSVQTTQSHHKNHPININIEQPVGISFKYDYGKFVFDATVTDLRPATEPGAGGTIVLTVPKEIEVIQRRSYFRVEVPQSLKVKVAMWRRKGRDNVSKQESETPGEATTYCPGTLVDISAGGAQVVLDGPSDGDSPPDTQFRSGQFVGMRFTPLP
ncbi:MAG: PilZ domain-containing protein, partial [Planctomycetota bacterium]